MNGLRKLMRPEAVHNAILGSLGATLNSLGFHPAVSAFIRPIVVPEKGSPFIDAVPDGRMRPRRSE